MSAPARSRWRTAPGRIALAAWVAVVCAVLLLPIVIIVVLAFSGQSYLSFPPQTLSLQWFARFFGGPEWMASLLLSTLIALVACAVATVCGFLAAYALSRSNVRGKALLLSLALMPAIVPTVVTSIALYFISLPLGLIGSVAWIGFCHAVLALPLVLLILLSMLQGVDANLERAALGLGASRWRVFTRVVVPLCAPGLVSAALFAFLTSFDELLVALFLTDLREQTLSVRIWNSLHLELEPTIAAANAALVGVTALALLADGLVRWLGRAKASTLQGDARTS